ncbi:MAG: fibronectin type III domain-containing protein, partial [Thermoguttaceae bacterium]|nr:fibronectin type III domain-containing protein [Thermoguttaceae bacterium]
GLDANTTYDVRIVARGDATWADSEYSATVSVSTKPKALTTLDAPTWKSSSMTANSITVIWNAVNNASGYVVEYKGPTDTNFTPLPETNATTLTITGLTSETTYKLRVLAVGDGDNYADSGYGAIKAVKTKTGSETPSTTVTTYEDVVNANDGKISLREAITLYANAGDTVTFAPALKDEAITLDPELGPINVGKNITIDASNLYSTESSTSGVTLNGDAATRIMEVASSVDCLTIIGVRFENGYTDGAGGAIDSHSQKLVVVDSEFIGNYAGRGGAISCDGAELVVQTSMFIGNTAEEGGAIYTPLRASVDNSTFDNNEATVLGGAICCYGSNLTVTDSEFTACRASRGGAIACDDSGDSHLIENSNFVFNEATTDGGAIYCYTATLVVNNSEFRSNRAKRGATVFHELEVPNADEKTIIERSSFSDNQAEEGGAIYSLDSETTVNHSEFIANIAGLGGAIYAGASTLIENSRFNSNQANRLDWTEGMGGAIFTRNSALTVKQSEFIANGSELGGAIFSEAQTVIENSLLAQNAALFGGAVELFGQLTLNGSTITNNDASYSGGGIDLDGTAVLNAYNSIIAGNTSTDGSDDVNKYIDALYDVKANAWNVLSSYTAWDSGVNRLTYDPNKPLFTDAAQGDYTLATGSQALNKGANAYATALTDLAGAPRIIGGTVDLGAYESDDVDLIQLVAPTWKSSSSTYNSVTVAWNPVDNASGYVVEYKSSTDSG